ncbi:MAG TPA: hypothetical protein VLS89_16585 [Candidatus Nanopelagicales bacterium]|nr:hypothetical protein [Candidatus Nanopelagicales bacterium]
MRSTMKSGSTYSSGAAAVIVMMGALSSACVADMDEPDGAGAALSDSADSDSVHEEGAQEDVGEADQALCAPYVYAVSPTTAKLNQQKAFTVYGNCLPSTTAFWIGECDNVQKVGWSPSQVVFTCTPKWSTGLKSGVVKDQPGGITLKNFTVQVTN